VTTDYAPISYRLFTDILILAYELEACVIANDLEPSFSLNSVVKIIAHARRPIVVISFIGYFARYWPIKVSSN